MARSRRCCIQLGGKTSTAPPWPSYRSNGASLSTEMAAHPIDAVRSRSDAGTDAAHRAAPARTVLDARRPSFACGMIRSRLAPAGSAARPKPAKMRVSVLLACRSADDHRPRVLSRRHPSRS